MGRDTEKASGLSTLVVSRYFSCFLMFVRWSRMSRGAIVSFRSQTEVTLQCVLWGSEGGWNPPWLRHSILWDLTKHLSRNLHLFLISFQAAPFAFLLLSVILSYYNFTLHITHFYHLIWCNVVFFAVFMYKYYWMWLYNVQISQLHVSPTVHNSSIYMYTSARSHL